MFRRAGLGAFFPRTEVLDLFGGQIVDLDAHRGQFQASNFLANVFGDGIDCLL